MELSSTAPVILGMLSWRPMSGYEIKSLVDKSTRNFWTASYGQIYPELRRLSAAGLIEGKAEPRGGRRRNVYRLTPAGRRELETWLGSDAETFRSEEHTSELQSHVNLVCRLLLEKKKKKQKTISKKKR